MASVLRTHLDFIHHGEFPRCACSHNRLSVMQGLVNDQHLLYGPRHKLEKGRFHSTSQRSIRLARTIGASLQSPCLSKKTVHLNSIDFSGMAKARFLPCEEFFTCRFCGPTRPYKSRTRSMMTSYAEKARRYSSDRPKKGQESSNGLSS